MRQVRVQERAAARLDEIYRHSRTRWGQTRAERYLHTLFASFEGVARGEVVSRPIPAEFGVNGFFYRCQKHFVYWKRLANGDIGIVTVLHQRMLPMAHLRDDFGDHD